MKKIPFSPPDIGEDEINSVIEVLRSGWITTGRKTKLFEEKIANYCGNAESICMNSATACLEMALRLLGIGPGDEVITSAYTYSATCSVICHVGAKPVLIDTGRNSFEMDYEKLVIAINDRTKAIIPVDLGGILCDYEKNFEIVNSKKKMFVPSNELQNKIGRIAIIADSAHSFGAKNSAGLVSGQIADFTVFSFHAVKNLTTAEGGALTWTVNHKDVYKNLALLIQHGQSKSAFEKTVPGCWEYDILLPGYKCNMTDISAAIGLSQLERFDKILKKREEIVEVYNECFKNENVEIFQKNKYMKNSSKHLYILRLNGINEKLRNKFIADLAEKGIASNVHYKPLPMFTAYKNLGFDIKNFQNSYEMYKNEITLPLHTKMSVDDAFYVSQIFKSLS